MLQTPFSLVSFGKSFMKIRSAVPKNGCLIFFAEQKKTKKTKKNICKTYTLPPHQRLRKTARNLYWSYHVDREIDKNKQTHKRTLLKIIPPSLHGRG